MSSKPPAARLPHPSRMRAQMPEGFPPPPRPPLGLSAWSDADADAVALVVALEDRDGSDLERASLVAAQVPSAASLPAGTLVVVMPGALRARGLLAPLLGPRREHLTVAARSTALLARGYVDIGCGVDTDGKTDLAWGYVPTP
jgi:hypothetical protein